MPFTRHGQTAAEETADFELAVAAVNGPSANLVANNITGVPGAAALTPSTPFVHLFEDLQSNPIKLLPMDPNSPAGTRADIEDALTNLGLTMQDPGEARIADSGIPAAYTYFGQFVDHDITSEQTQGIVIANVRTPDLDLDSVYGAGSVRDGNFMVLGTVGRPGQAGVVPGDDKDLPRTKASPGNSGGQAQIGDPRNDENLIIAQLHVAFLRAHNNAVIDKQLSFAEAQTLIRQHYQWIVLHDFLKRIADPAIVDKAAVKNEFFTPPDPLLMPYEFSVAAFRFGHSMVREKYNNFSANVNPAGLDQLFAFTGTGGFGGFQPKDALPAIWVIDWSKFVDVGNKPNLARRIDPTLVPALFEIPTQGLNGFPGNANLSVRNLLRGYIRNLPTGQAIAQRMGFTPLSVSEIESVAEAVSDDQLAAVRQSQFTTRTPLWYYILAEAARPGQDPGQDGRLGPVGSTIVAEVLLEILRQSTDSILAPQPSNKPWAPTLPSSTGKFDLPDLLRFAGVL
jgi:heme peroxidase